MRAELSVETSNSGAIMPAGVDFRVRSKMLVRSVWVLAGLVIVGNVAFQLTDHHDYFGHFLVLRLFDVTIESSFPTWLSSTLFLASGLLIWSLGASGEVGTQRMWAWRLVSGLLAAFSIDEVASIHETTSGVVRRALGLDGFLYYAWVVPAAALLLVVAILLLPWFIALPRRLRRALLIAGALFASGTFGLELVGGNLISSGLTESSSEWILVASIEESLELISLVVLFSALLSHSARTGHLLRFRILER